MSSLFQGFEPDGLLSLNATLMISMVCLTISSTITLLYLHERYSIDIRIESACVLRRVELHGRELEEGQPPWSIRQTGVYHRLSVSTDSEDSPLANPISPSEQFNSTFILIAPSQNFEAQLSQSFELSIADDRAIGPWNIYRLLVANSLSGWLDYMTWLEDSLKEQVS